MLSLLLAEQQGIPVAVWIILGIIVGIVLLVIAIKSFWISKTIASLLNLGATVVCILGMADAMDLAVTCIICVILLTVSWVFIAGNDVFDSNTEGDYLIFGTLVHESNHPVSAFFGTIGAFAFCFALLFWAAYAWAMIIGLILCILSLALSVGLIIEHIRNS